MPLRTNASQTSVRSRATGGTSYFLLAVEAIVARFAIGTATCLPTAISHVIDDTSVDIREPNISAGMAVRQTLVVEPQEVKYRGVQVMNVNGGFDGIPTEFVCCSVHRTPLHASAGEPHREAEIVVLTASKAHEDLLRSRTLKVDSYMTKPVELDKFLAVVKELNRFWLAELKNLWLADVTSE